MYHAPLASLTLASTAAVYGYDARTVSGLLIDTGSPYTVLQNRNKEGLTLGQPVGWRNIRWKGEKHRVNIYALRVELASADARRYATWDAEIGFANIAYPVEGVLGLADFLDVFDLALSSRDRRYTLTANANFFEANGAVRNQPEFNL